MSHKQKWSVDPESGCWIWLMAISDTGYGVAWNAEEYRLEPAHRYVYKKFKGAIPQGSDLDHLCRVRHCVNPEHLAPVTRAENAHRGARTKLTQDQVLRMRELNSEGIGYRRLAKMFGMSRAAIRAAVLGTNWKDLSSVSANI